MRIWLKKKSCKLLTVPQLTMATTYTTISLPPLTIPLQLSSILTYTASLTPPPRLLQKSLSAIPTSSGRRPDVPHLHSVDLFLHKRRSPLDRSLQTPAIRLPPAILVVAAFPQRQRQCRSQTSTTNSTSSSTTSPVRPPELCTRRVSQSCTTTSKRTLTRRRRWIKSWSRRDPHSASISPVHSRAVQLRTRNVMLRWHRLCLVRPCCLQYFHCIHSHLAQVWSPMGVNEQ